MEPEPAVIASLRRAVAAMPDDLTLRLHLASLLLAAGQHQESIRHLGAIVHADPANAEALALLQRATAGPPPAAPPSGVSGPAGGTGVADGAGVVGGAGAFGGTDVAGGAEAAGGAGVAGGAGAAGAAGGGDAPQAAAPASGPTSADGAAPTGGATSADGTVPTGGAGPAGRSGEDGGRAAFDWAEAEAELRGVLPPMFVTADGASAEEPGTAPDAYDSERPGLRLADVAGLAEVKARLEAAFLAPLRNPELRRLYHKSLRGGLLLYGPPGCGKTFIARAVAGELGARFLAVSFADVVDMFIGQSERNIRELFTIARSKAPCVLFLDEVDAIGQKRSQVRSAPIRSAVNQLLLELDDVSGSNEGVFVLAASNHPWDVDSALRRPGRFDRTLLVLPPDAEAREAVFRFHLRDRPVAGVELTRLAALTEGYSAADIAHVCESAAEAALLASARAGELRLIGQGDLTDAVAQVRPSIGPWFESARNVALFANEGGAYDDLVAYLKKRKML
ncbi:MAG: ATP-binding protein [Streptosporangiaceae bacterium]